MTKRSPFRYFRTSPEIIRLAVMMYIRIPLSLSNVEDLLHERWHRCELRIRSFPVAAIWAKFCLGNPQKARATHAFSLELEVALGESGASTKPGIVVCRLQGVESGIPQVFPVRFETGRAVL